MVDTSRAGYWHSLSARDLETIIIHDPGRPSLLNPLAKSQRVSWHARDMGHPYVLDPTDLRLHFRQTAQDDNLKMLLVVDSIGPRLWPPEDLRCVSTDGAQRGKHL